MLTIDPVLLKTHRDQAFNLLPGHRLASAQESLQFVNQRGFVFFWPIKGVDLPSLWTATAGNRPVPDEHDDPGHVTWGWKDELLDKRVWYYARLLRRRNTIASLDIAANFYALSPNYGDPLNDYLQQYDQGLLTLEARQIYEVLLQQGPLHTIALRKAARMTSPDSETRFNRALDALQIEMKILPVGIAKAGAWRYAFIYDLVPRHLPDIPEKARGISEPEARRHLIQIYLQSVGAARPEKIQQLFSWRTEDTRQALQKLSKVGQLVENAIMPNEEQNKKNAGNWIALPQIVRENS